MAHDCRHLMIEPFIHRSTDPALGQYHVFDTRPEAKAWLFSPRFR